MSEPFIGEIRLFSSNFPPRGWAFCNGQTLYINQNQALYTILGVTYGGDGVTTFALPDLRGRVPVHPGNGIVMGKVGGEENHTLTVSEMPAHNHILTSGNDNDSSTPSGNVWGTTPSTLLPYSHLQPHALMNAASIANVGGGQPHPNMQPYAVVNYCIALEGIYPSRN